MDLRTSDHVASHCLVFYRFLEYNHAAFVACERFQDFILARLDNHRTHLLIGCTDRSYDIINISSLLPTYQVTLVQPCFSRAKIPIARSNQPFTRLRPTRKVRLGISVINPAIFGQCIDIAGYQDSRHGL